jgi:hypothetical protein
LWPKDKQNTNLFRQKSDFFFNILFPDVDFDLLLEERRTDFTLMPERNPQKAVSEPVHVVYNTKAGRMRFH